MHLPLPLHEFAVPSGRAGKAIHPHTPALPGAGPAALCRRRRARAAPHRPAAVAGVSLRRGSGRRQGRGYRRGARRIHGHRRLSRRRRASPRDRDPPRTARGGISGRTPGHRTWGLRGRRRAVGSGGGAGARAAGYRHPSRRCATSPRRRAAPRRRRRRDRSRLAGRGADAAEVGRTRRH